VVPKRALEKLRAICLSLPDAYEEEAWVGVRWMVRKKNFAHVLHIDRGRPPAYAKAAGNDGPVTVLTFRIPALAFGVADSDPRFFSCIWGTRWQTKVMGTVIDRDVDWKEVASLVAESHGLLASKRQRRAR